MSIQSRLGGFSQTAGGPLVDRLPDPPEDNELDTVIAPNELYPFPVDEVAGIEELRREIRDIIFFSDDYIEAWSRLLGDHVSYGNKKVADETAIFNLGSAHDCVNLGTKYCQVSDKHCYAAQSERNYPQPLDYRRRQAIIWSLLDGVTWARAFRRHAERKRNPVDALRFNESGDFSTRQDILKLETIGHRLDDLVDTYTYSASSDLPWKEVESVTINQSNDFRDYGRRRFIVVDSVSDIPQDGIRCAHDLDESVKCGDCRLCVDDDADFDIYVKNFYTDEEDETHTPTDSLSLSEYAEAIQSGLPDTWSIAALEEEENAVEDASMILDGAVVSDEANAIIQIVPIGSGEGESGYSANRVRVQDREDDNKCYVGLSATDVDIPPGGVNEAVATGSIDPNVVVKSATFPDQTVIHGDSGSANTTARSTFWNPDMTAIAVLAAVAHVEKGQTNQAGLSAF